MKNPIATNTARSLQPPFSQTCAGGSSPAFWLRAQAMPGKTISLNPLPAKIAKGIVASAAATRGPTKKGRMNQAGRKNSLLARESISPRMANTDVKVRNGSPAKSRVMSGSQKAPANRHPVCAAAQKGARPCRPSTVAS